MLKIAVGPLKHFKLSAVRGLLHTVTSSQREPRRAEEQLRAGAAIARTHISFLLIFQHQAFYCGVPVTMSGLEAGRSGLKLEAGNSELEQLRRENQDLKRMLSSGNFKCVHRAAGGLSNSTLASAVTSSQPPAQSTNENALPPRLNRLRPRPLLLSARAARYPTKIWTCRTRSAAAATRSCTGGCGEARRLQ